MIRVWWTIPDSAVAWEWRPAKTRLVEATRVVEDDGSQYLQYADQSHGPGAYMGLPIGQPLADTTALFAQEANIVPRNLIITWIEGRSATRWDRNKNHWTCHAVTLRLDAPRVGPPRSTPDIPEDLKRPGELLRWDPVKAAGEIAVRLLGLTRVPTSKDALALEVEQNQVAIYTAGASSELREKLRRYYDDGM
jgi:hypothetical protein